MFKILYYNWRNLVYYRKSRPVAHSRLMDIGLARVDGIDAVKRAMTSGILASVGLKIVDNDADTVPWYIRLSKIQKSWVKMVSPYYKVGLT